MASHEQGKAEVSLKLRNRPADMGLADAKSRRRSRHSAVAHHGTKQVDMGRVHIQHALFAWKREDMLFDGMNATLSNFSHDSQRPVLFDPRRSCWDQHRYSAGAEWEPGRRPKLGCLVRLRE